MYLLVVLLTSSFLPWICSVVVVVDSKFQIITKLKKKRLFIATTAQTVIDLYPRLILNFFFSVVFEPV